MDNLVIVSVWFSHYQESDENTVSITEQSEMDTVYSILKETTNLHTNKHPRHFESIQFDSKWMIRLEYRNGMVDEFYATERGGGIFRFLDTKGSGERGYIMGKNDKIWDFIAELERKIRDLDEKLIVAENVTK